MIIEVDAPLKGSHYDWLWPDEKGGGGAFLFIFFTQEGDKQH